MRAKGNCVCLHVFVFVYVLLRVCGESEREGLGLGIKIVCAGVRKPNRDSVDQPRTYTVQH
jgi:hypothetical protein